MSLFQSGVLQADPYLTNLSIEYANRPDGWIGAKVLPVISTNGLVTGRFRKFTLGNRFRKFDDVRARMTRSAGVRAGMDTDDTFACIERALHDGFTQREAKTFMSNGLNLDEFAVRLVTDALLLNREARVAALLLSSSVITHYSALTGNDRWDITTSADADPFADIETARDSIHSLTGAEMNTVILGRQVFYKARRSPVVIDVVKYTMQATSNKLTPALLAAAFDVDTVHVGNPLYVTTKEGQSETLGYVWGKNAVGMYVNPAPTNQSLTTGAIFSVNGNEAPLMDKWDERGVKGTFVEGTVDDVEKIIAANCAYLFQTVVS